MATVFEMLDREWRQMSGDRATARRLAGVCRLAGDARTLGEAEAFVRRAPADRADRVLLALVARAVDATGRDRTGRRSPGASRGGRETGDGDGLLAARVLLQLLVPGARTMARRWWALGDADERAAAAVAAVYGRIRAYPLARRPGRVAANVLMDAERELRRRAAAGVVITPAADPVAHLPRRHRDEAESHPALHPALELTEVLRDAVHDRVIDAGDAELIARSRIAGERVVDIAARRGAGARTLWDRRQRAEHALAAAHQHGQAAG